MDLALRLHMSLQRVKRETTSREFMMWRVKLERTANEFNPFYYYLARIALEVARLRFKDPTKGTIQDFLIPFKRPEPPAPVTPEQREKNIASKKSFWRGLLRINAKADRQSKR